MEKSLILQKTWYRSIDLTVNSNLDEKSLVYLQVCRQSIGESLVLKKYNESLKVPSKKWEKLDDNFEVKINKT